MRRWLRQVGWALIIFSGVGALSAAAIFGLAIAALYDDNRGIEAVAGGDIELTQSGPIVVTADADGAARVYRGERLISVIRGHRAPLVQASLIDRGREVLTIDTAGETRVTRLASAERYQYADVHERLELAYRRLWDPYLRRPADWALFVVAQVLPLSIPEHRRGDRGDVFRDCEACPEMIELKPGAFLMGSPVLEVGRDANEGPRRLVTISNPFALGRFEVTSAQWNACVADGGCGDLLGADQTPSDGNIPVVVGWDDAKKYVNWLSDKTGFAYYLPSEKEWEYAARAGTTSAYPWGDSEGQGFANCKSCGSRPSNGLSRVGSFAANPFGFYDMHGNVREWAVCYGEQPGCSDRVLRGGSWRDSDGIRSAYRSFNFDRRDDTGFRVAKKLDLFPNQPR